VDGVRTMMAAIGAGSRIRVGRTDLSVVVRGEAGDARGDGLVAASQAMLDVLETVERVARLEWPVLVTGESGVGKEGVARAVHARSTRRSRPLVSVNAGGISESLIESELFGHEKGAFTGAQSTHRGVFEQADGGTLFFDEIGELPLSMQTRLLRVLETGDVRRVGSESHLRVDVRLVCATHRDLRAEVAAGRFREDLYYRLVRLPIAIPPLRARPDDVGPLVEHFLRAARSETGPRAITEGAVARLRAHGWPGNVRELRNVVQAAAAFSAGVIDVRDVEDAIVMLSGRDALGHTAPPGLSMVVRKHRDNVSAAARELGVARSTLRDRLARGKR
jgi:two-component system NtrC family response regulator